MPFFSIIMPTRNRASLLINNALKSVLQQDFTDFEVIICDNASIDNTRTVVKDISEPRVNYIYSSPWMPKEKFFEFSLRHAKGKYSILFFDDDVFIAGALRKCYEILNNFSVDVFTFPNSIHYLFPDWHRSKERNLLRIQPYTDQIYIRRSKDQLQQVFAQRTLLPGTPDVTNSFYKTSFIHEMIKRYGTLFPHGHMGDYNIACYVLANTEYFLYCDSPIIIFGQWSQNTSQQLHDLKTTMPEYQDWIAWVSENLLATMPFKSYLFSNCKVATLIDMKNRLGLSYEIDWSGYFNDIRSDITRLKRLGIDVSHLEEEYNQALRSHIQTSQPENIRAVSKIKKNLLGKIGLNFRGEYHNFNSIMSAQEFYVRLQKYRAKVNYKQQKQLYISLMVGESLSKLIRIVFGQRIYHLILKKISTLARLIKFASDN